MKPLATLFLGLTPLTAQADDIPSTGLPNHVILELVEDNTGEFNQAQIDFEVIIGNSSGISKLTGCIEATLNIDPITGTTNQLTLLSTDLDSTDASLSASSILGDYTIALSGLDFEVDTPNPPGLVTPETGSFNAAQYQFTVVEGIIDGTFNAPLISPDPIPIGYDYGDNNFIGNGQGPGSVTLNPTVIQNGRQFYEVTGEFPVIFTQLIDDPTLPVTATAIISGNIKATGTTFVYLPGFPQWAADQGLEPDSENAFDLSISAPNEIIYALGFNATTAPKDILTITSEAVIVTPSETLAQQDVEIQWSSNLKDWDRVPQSVMIVGNSLITEGTDLDNSIGSGFGDGTKPFFRLAIPVADPE